MKKILFTIGFVLSIILAFAQTGLPFDVQHYTFNISLSDSSDVIKGRAFITLKFLSDVNSFDLDLVKSDNTRGMKVEAVSGDKESVSFTHSGNKLSIRPAKAQRSGDLRTYEIVYSGIPKDGLIIAKSKFGKRTFFSDNWPDRAQNWLPCIDHPGDKASVEFIITAPDHYQVISNGIQIEETNLPGDYKLTHWKEDVPLPTKIMVIGVAEFAVQYVGDESGIPVYSWVYPENKKEGFYDYEPAKDILPFFIDYVGPYGYKKLANVQSKTIFGGMENASAIFYSEGSVSGKRSIEGLLAHEIAHQWFGNMASEKNFSHVWLSEGFATYFTNLYMEKKYGREKLIEMLTAQRNEVISFSRENKKPVVDTGTNYMELLNANSYQKGGWILHMLRTMVGDETFRKIIRIYYERYAGKNADSDDFRKVGEEISGKDLKQFFHQWLNVPGQPDLDLNWNYDTNKKEISLTVTQKQTTVFVFPLSLQLQTDGKLSYHSMIVDKKQQTFTIKANQRPGKIIADPETNLLAEIKVSGQ